MNDVIKLHYAVDGDNFLSAGEASSAVKKSLTQIGIDPNVIRKVAIAMYEGEINMVIHANGGDIFAYVTKDEVKVVLEDKGPGIKDISLAMKEGYSTASPQVRELGFGAGMGLPNIKNYTDSLNITSEVGVGTRVEFSIKL